MCGICGVLEAAPAAAPGINARIVAGMTAALRHRGPDGEGYWSDPGAGIWLGHRRLAVIDPSPAGDQPMRSADGRFVIAYNGEIYNHRDIASELARAGRRLRGHCDTEVLLEAVSLWGLAESLRRVNGMFAFALWDVRERRLVLARDRMGEKPLYYGLSGGRLLFGSELKALAAHPQFERRVDRRALASFLRLNCIPAPHTIYTGVFKLPPGTCLSLGPADLARLPAPSVYWRLPEPGAGVAAAADSIEAQIAETRALLRDAVQLRRAADVPLGVFLSGGLDSSAVAALLQAQSTTPIKTYTLGFEAFGFDEAPCARRIARHLGCDHTEAYVSAAQAQALVPELAGIYDEPFSDSSQIPTLLIARMAREHVTVVLSGDGGDELFGGYNRHVLARRLRAFNAAAPGGLRAALRRGLQSLSPAAWDRIFAVLGAVLPRRRRPLPPGERMHKLAELLRHTEAPALYSGLISHWDAADTPACDTREYPPWGAEPAPWQAGADLAAIMMYLDACGYLPDDVLVKLDRASMAVGLEARAPFLDHRLVEHAMRLPVDLKIRDGRGKWILRRILREHVPDALLARPKMGFAVPLADWLRGPLRDWTEHLLDERRLREQGYLDPAPVRRLWAAHLGGRRNWQYHLWDVLMFQAWLERWA